MQFAPLARIALRYGVGFILGSEAGEALALDQDVVMYLALAIAAGTGTLYALAKKKGCAV